MKDHTHRPRVFLSGFDQFFLCESPSNPGEDEVVSCWVKGFKAVMDLRGRHFTPIS